MSRIQGLARPNSLLTALAFRWSHRRYSKVLQPLKVAALDGKLLLAFGHMEWAQQRARTMPQEVKHLARTPAAMQVNCPWCLDFGLREGREMGVPEEKLHAAWCQAPVFQVSSKRQQNERYPIRSSQRASLCLQCPTRAKRRSRLNTATPITYQSSPTQRG